MYGSILIMHPLDTNSFEITWEDQKLNLISHSLPHEQKIYIEKYLEKVNRYKIIGFHQQSPVFSLYQSPLATAVGVMSLKMRLARRFHHQRIPSTATLSLTKACQCDCTHCSSVFYNQSLKRDLTTEELKKVITQTIDLGATTIIFLGGEPLLRRDLCELIACIPQDKATVILFTNGEYLTESMCQRLKMAGLIGAFISLDSTDEATHDCLRQRPGLFSKVLAGIQNMKKAHLLVGISSYLSPQILADGGFEKMMELAKKNGAHEVTFFDAIPSGRWLHENSFLLEPKDRILIKNMVSLYRGRYHYPGLSVQSTMTSECGSAFCFAANTQFYLTASGDMCPCDFTPLTVGHFPDRSIKELWEEMISTSPYQSRAKSCRMQDPAFRSRYIQAIPAHGPIPYPLQNFAKG